MTGYFSYPLSGKPAAWYYDKTGQNRYNRIASMSINNFFTVKEVASKLRVSERSVMRYIKAKKLKASKMGQWRIKEKDLERFFNANSNHRK